MKLSIKKSFFIVLGTGMIALAAAEFFIPYNLLTGGVSGVAVILHPIIHVSKDIIASAISISMFIFGTLFLGKEWSIKTALSTLIFSPALLLFSRYLPPVDVDPLLACLYGGLLGGAGVGLVIRQGGSTGGMDVPPLLMNKYLKLDVSKGILLTDALTVVAGLLQYNISNVLLGLVSVYFTSIGVNKAMEFGSASAKELKIISDKYEEINNEILKTLDRGTTILDGEGGFTGEKKKMIMCVVPDNQYQPVLDAVNKFDDKAFVIVSETKDVHGEGFSVNVRI